MESASYIFLYVQYVVSLGVCIISAALSCFSFPCNFFLLLILNQLLKWDHSENIPGAGGFLIFAGEIWVPPCKDLQNLGAPRGAPLRGLTESGYPPPLTYILMAPLYVFYGLIWTISDFLIVNIWQNLGNFAQKIGKIWLLPTQTNGKIWEPPQKPPPSNVFWMLPKLLYSSTIFNVEKNLKLSLFQFPIDPLWSKSCVKIFFVISFASTYSNNNTFLRCIQHHN